MVFQNQRVPSDTVIGDLRVQQAFLELEKIKRLPEEFLSGDVVGCYCSAELSTN
jgi:hypothetical protein